MMAFCQPLFVRPTDSDHDGLLSATFCPTDVGLSATASDDVGQLTLLVLLLLLLLVLVLVLQLHNQQVVGVVPLMVMLLLLLVLVLVLRYDDDVGLSTTTSDDVGRLTLLS